jgi:hypothetical protein
LHNRLNQYDSVGGTNYSYDNKGNLINNGAFNKYYYDCENRLTDVNTVADVSVANYDYDYQGRRIQKTEYSSQNTTKYCYDSDHVVAEYDGNNVLLRKLVFGPGIDEPICMIDVENDNAVAFNEAIN